MFPLAAWSGIGSDFSDGQQTLEQVQLAQPETGQLCASAAQGRINCGQITVRASSNANNLFTYLVSARFGKLQEPY